MVKASAMTRPTPDTPPRPSGSAVFVPPSGPPQGPGPSREIFARMGQEAIFRLCADFYDEIGRSPIRPLFSEDLREASKKFAAFLVGVCGGPPLYRQTYGEPMMRARHLPFAIDESARQAWLACFRRTLEGAEERYGFPAEHRAGLLRFLEDFSAWMVNRR